MQPAIKHHFRPNDIWEGLAYRPLWKIPWIKVTKPVISDKYTVPAPLPSAKCAIPYPAICLDKHLRQLAVKCLYSSKVNKPVLSFWFWQSIYSCAHKIHLCVWFLNIRLCSLMKLKCVVSLRHFVLQLLILYFAGLCRLFIRTSRFRMNGARCALACPRLSE